MSEALKIWRAKLDFLQLEEAKAVDSEQKFNIAERIKETKAKIEELEASTARLPSASGALHVDISCIIKYAPAELIGREDETKLLSDAWNQAVRGEPKRSHVLTVVALGGEGKTSLVAKWAAELAYQDWPGCDAVFAWSFYHQGTDEKTADSSDLFLKDALTFFGDSEVGASSQHTSDKGRRLAQLVGQRRALLILDGLEPLQYAPTSPMPGALKDQGIAALLKGLAATSHGICIVTTRYSIPDLGTYRQTTAPEIKLTRLSKEAGVSLLRSLEVKGTQPEFETLVEDVKGHALTLNLLGTYLRDAHAGDIRRRDLVKLHEADAEEQGCHAFRVVDAYVKSFETGAKNAEERKKGHRALALLRLLGLFDRPAIANCLQALWNRPAIKSLTEPLVTITEEQRNVALKRLEDAKLLTVNRDTGNRLLSLDAHPLLREYVAKRLQEQQPKAWRAAHRRLYEHLCETTKEGDQPTLEDLQPLYQAVAHGCQAGLQQETCNDVYKRRLLRGSDHYTWHTLGAYGPELGAQTCFFETPWSRISPMLAQADQSLLLSDCGYTLRALGRLTEALEPMQGGMESAAKREDWENAAWSANNLSELKLTLGDVLGAVREGDQAVIYAGRRGDPFLQLSVRTVYADALHQANHGVEAKKWFREAEEMQAQVQCDFPLLYGLAGFRYCDLLLAGAERAAWAVSYGGGPRPPEDRFAYRAELGAVLSRATQTLNWWINVFANTSPLDLALEHLTLGRTALYGAIVEGCGSSFDPLQSPQRGDSDSDGLERARCELDSAVENIRRSGHREHFSPALLARAWLRSLTGARTGPESTQSDLDEAREIAERGPMPLFMADIHLHRARIFFREANYPWESPQKDLAEARRLIEKCVYWRRKEELEDAEEAIIGKSKK